MVDMSRVKLTVEYDGTNYVGWQVQPNGPSVQACIEGALAKLLGTTVSVFVSGRTDSGVHALGQVIAFDHETNRPLKAFVQGLNSLMPDDVAVLKAEEVPADFDPRRWARGKVYRYRISNRPVRSPLRRFTHWEIFKPLDVDAMRVAAKALLGRHDFSAFRAADCQAAHAVREIFAVDIEGDGGGDISIRVHGSAFLKHMVRNLVGTLFEVGRGAEKPEWVAEVLAARDRTRSGQTAPAHGLCLETVFYGDGPRRDSGAADE